MTTLMEKAREVGRELRNSEQFKRLESAERQLQQDEVAQQLIEQTRDAQQKLMLAQKMGTEPDQEQVAHFHDKKEQMSANITVGNLLTAQQEFDQILSSVNDAITGILRGEESGDRDETQDH